ncbi:MAG TPA: hypothetical protein VGW12_06870 [Pyrinomonadaceae bacterium]|nr:hypothetical protein [Pyrinomonadaceae bacterium]
MNYGIPRTASPAWAVVLLLAATVAYAWKPELSTSEAAAPPPQDVTRIESRLSLMEQRFYSIEASIRSLEQQVRFSSNTSGARAARDPELDLFRSELETLRRRLAEVECGLTRVDERTLTAAARQARRENANGAAATDPCRLNPAAPLRLTSRP